MNKLNAGMVKVYKRPDVQTRLTEMGAEFVGSTAQALNEQLANDLDAGEVGEGGGVRVE